MLTSITYVIRFSFKFKLYDHYFFLETQHNKIWERETIDVLANEAIHNLYRSIYKDCGKNQHDTLLS